MPLVAPSVKSDSRRRYSAAPYSLVAPPRVVDLGCKLVTAGVAPGVLGGVATLHEHLLRGDVLGLPRQPAAALEQQDPLPRRGQVSGQGSAPRARPDDDHVVMGHQGVSYRV